MEYSGESIGLADARAREREHESDEREAEIAEAMKDADIAKVRHITAAIRQMHMSPAMVAQIVATLSAAVTCSTFSHTSTGQNAIEYLDDAFTVLEGGAE